MRPRRAHGYLGFASWLQEHFAEATAECTTALAMFREIGDAEGITWSLISLAAVARYEGSAGRAAALLADSLAAAEKIGFREGIGWSLELQGLLAADRGDPAAAGLLLRSLRTHHELNDRWRTASVLEDLAALALAGGRARQAARLMGAAERIRDTIGTVLPPCEAGQHTTTEAAREPRWASTRSRWPATKERWPPWTTCRRSGATTTQARRARPPRPNHVLPLTNRRRRITQSQRTRCPGQIAVARPRQRRPGRCGSGRSGRPPCTAAMWR